MIIQKRSAIVIQGSSLRKLFQLRISKNRLGAPEDLKLNDFLPAYKIGIQGIYETKEILCLHKQISPQSLPFPKYLLHYNLFSAN